jgi:CysZ protein
VNPLTGAAAFFQGMGFIVSTPGVWLRSMVPILAALFLFAGFTALGIFGATVLTHGVLVVLLAVPVIVVALLLALSLAQPLSGWALEGIVRAQRQELGLPGLPETSKGAAMLSSLGSALLALAIGTPIIALLTVVGWIFPPAMVVTLPLKILVGALVVAWDLVDYPLAMRGARVVDRMRFMGRSFGSFLGFGLAATAFFAVPFLGLLALPCGVAGATRLTSLSKDGT